MSDVHIRILQQDWLPETVTCIPRRTAALKPEMPSSRKMFSASVHHPLQNNDPHYLPPAVKRKCLSSLERLRLAEDLIATDPSSLKSTSGTVKTSRPCVRPQRPSLPRRNSSYFKNPIAPRKKVPSPTNDTFSPSDARWYLRLPDKVQRRDFTQEERSLLSGCTESTVSDAADKKIGWELYKLNRIASQGLPALQASSRSSLSSLSTFNAEQPPDSAIDMNLDDSVIWFDDDNELDLALDDYHQFYRETETKIDPKKRGPSFRRALSLTSLPFEKNAAVLRKAVQTTTPTPQVATPIPRDTPSPSQPRSNSLVPSIPPGSTSALEDSATYYQDPEARLKLRVYLASPQKFDEAIEFGFPSMEDKDSRPLKRPSLSRSRYTAPSKTFLHDDSPSLFDASDDNNDDDDAASLPERAAPYTPVSTTFDSDATLLSPSNTPSITSSSFFSKPNFRQHDPEALAHLLAGGREMTLRMTLTRPDLRDDEKALYASTTGDDPLALEHLPPSKREVDIWSSPSKERSVIKKFWRKMSGKSCL